MKYTKSQITEYAHDYLSGGNMVPVGVLDDAFFKSECKRLWGPEPTAEEKAAEHRRTERLLAKLIQARSKLLGPRGGAPKSGPALQQYKNLTWNIGVVQAHL